MERTIRQRILSTRLNSLAMQIQRLDRGMIRQWKHMMTWPSKFKRVLVSPENFTEKNTYSARFSRLLSVCNVTLQHCQIWVLITGLILISQLVTNYGNGISGSIIKNNNYIFSFLKYIIINQQQHKRRKHERSWKVITRESHVLGQFVTRTNASSAHQPLTLILQRYFAYSCCNWGGKSPPVVCLVRCHLETIFKFMFFQSKLFNDPNADLNLYFLHPEIQDGGQSRK